MRIAVLGCGPAGLLAAHACQMKGNEVYVYSRKFPSPMGGAQYLHRAIPVVTEDDPDGDILFIKLGEREEYARKLYGDPDAPCSWDEFEEGYQPAWSLRAAYQRLWDMYEHMIVDRNIRFPEARSIAANFDLTISTIPAPILCSAHHRFDYKEVLIAKEHRDACEQLGDPCVIYNGQDLPYYRTSLIFGEGSTEYPWEHQNVKGFVNPNDPGVVNAVIGKKPRGTDCTCEPHIMRVGRFGTWKPGVLVHHAFEEVYSVV